MLTPDTIRDAPKAMLHDHLDGGLRPATVIDLASEFGYEGLPTTDVEALTAWFRRGADRKSLELYLETFAHTTGVMQERDAIAPGGSRVRGGPGGRRHRLRRGALCAGALDRTRPDARRGGGGQPRGVPAGLGARGRGRPADRHEDARHRDAPGRPLGRGRRVCGPLARRGRGRLRHRRAGGGLPPDPPPRCVRVRPPGELPHHHPRGRIVRAAVDLGGAPVVRRRAPGPRRPDRRRHHGPRRRDGGPRSPGRVRARPPRAARDVPHLEHPHGCRGRRSPSTRSTSSAASATG